MLFILFLHHTVFMCINNISAAALRGVALTRGRAAAAAIANRGVYSAAALAAAAAVRPQQLAQAATALPFPG